jgi:hypothetical protein
MESLEVSFRIKRITSENLSVLEKAPSVVLHE